MDDIVYWTQKARSLSNDELVKVWLAEKGEYRHIYLEAVKEELSQRGFTFEDNELPPRLVTPEGLKLKRRETLLDNADDHVPYKGVGGWLMLFVLSQFACRPLWSIS